MERSARSTLAACVACSRSWARARPGSGPTPGGSRRDRRPGPAGVGRGPPTGALLAVDHGFGHLGVDEAGERIRDLVLERVAGLARAVQPLADVVAKLGDGVELRGFVGEVVVGVGEELLPHLLHQDAKARNPPRPGRGAGSAQDVPGLGAAELAVDLGHDGLGADLVDVVVGGQAFDWLPLVRAGDVDGDVMRDRSPAGIPR